MISKRLLVAMFAVFLAAIAPARQADASVHKISLDGARYDDNGFVPMPQSCGAMQPGLCTVAGSGVVRWTGALTGWSEYHAYAHYDPASRRALADIWERFVTVRVDGCGVGSILTHGSAVVDPHDQNPTTAAI